MRTICLCRNKASRMMLDGVVKKCSGRNDSAEAHPFGGPRLVVLEQTLIHAGAKQVGERGGGGVGLGDARDGGALRDANAAQRGGVAKACDAGVACDACVCLANAAEWTDLPQAGAINLQIEHSVERGLDLFGLGNHLSNRGLLVAIAANKARSDQRGKHLLLRLEVGVELALLKDAPLEPCADRGFDGLSQRRFEQATFQGELGAFQLQFALEDLELLLLLGETLLEVRLRIVRWIVLVDLRGL